MLSALETIRYITLGIGLIGSVNNAILFYVMICVDTVSRLNTFLLRMQTLFDFYASFMISLSNITGDSLNTSSIIMKWIFCLLWSYDVQFWFGVILSVHNLVCISVTRALAVFKPVLYKLSQTKLIIACSIYLIVISTVMFIPIPLNRQVKNGTCLPTSLLNQYSEKLLYTVHGFVWFLVIYLGPAVTMIISHVLIFWRIRKKGLFVFNMTCSIVRKDATDTRMIQLLFSSVTLSCFYLVLYALDAVSYLLSSNNVLEYEVGSLRQQTGVMLMVLCSTVNPVVVFCFNLPLRVFLYSKLLGTCRNCCGCCPQRNTSEQTTSAKQASQQAED